jgi:hypothetical protein
LEKLEVRIYVDADACPVVRIIEHLAKQYQVPCILLCDINHILSSNIAMQRHVTKKAR